MTDAEKYARQQLELAQKKAELHRKQRELRELHRKQRELRELQALQRELRELQALQRDLEKFNTTTNPAPGWTFTHTLLAVLAGALLLAWASKYF